MIRKSMTSHCKEDSRGTAKVAKRRIPCTGYTWSFWLYSGKNRGEMPTSQKAIISLMEAAGLLRKGYDLYLDNWYSSPTLFHVLMADKRNAVGTGRANRKYKPSDFPKKQAIWNSQEEHSNWSPMYQVGGLKNPPHAIHYTHKPCGRNQKSNDVQWRGKDTNNCNRLQIGMKGVDSHSHTPLWQKQSRDIKRYLSTLWRNCQCISDTKVCGWTDSKAVWLVYCSREGAPEGVSSWGSSM